MVGERGYGVMGERGYGMAELGALVIEIANEIGKLALRRRRGRRTLALPLLPPAPPYDGWMFVLNSGAAALPSLVAG